MHMHFLYLKQAQERAELLWGTFQPHSPKVGT
ncbi:hypothetical protein DFAR_1880009 [Desulfarculales bacterium]